MFESLVARLATASWYPDWLPFTAAQRALPLVVIVVALAAGGHRLPGRGALAQPAPARSPTPRHVARWALLLVPLALVLVIQTSGTLRLHLYITLASAIVLLSITLLTGFTGQVSLAQAVFAGAAGFVTARLADGGVPFPLSPLLGAGVATVVGLLMALPALRIRGAQLAVVTMAAGIAIEELVFRNPSVVGTDRAILVPPPELFGLDLAANRAPDFNRWEFGVLLVVVLAATALATSNLRRAGTGRRLLALRANERAAAAAGIDVTRTKLLAFGLSSFVAGIGGAMLAYLRGGVSADAFSVFISLTFLAFAYLGGIGSVTGALVGAVLIPGGLLVGVLGGGGSGSSLGTYVPLLGGLALIATTILAPEGLAGLARRRAPSPRGGR